MSNGARRFVVACALGSGMLAGGLTAMPAAAQSCEGSYPTLCIPIGAPDMDCWEVGVNNFPVSPPDPHYFDGDYDGIGCEA
jgi:hypothetical protein